MITVDVKGIERMVSDLKKLAAKAAPFAIRNSLNASAFEARRRWADDIKRSFTLRNTFTERSLRVEKVKGMNPERMHSRVGSVAPYMGDQERGSTVRGRGRHKAIPAPAAAGQPPGGKRTRVVRAANKLSAIRVPRNIKGRSRQQRNAAALSMARRKGTKFALLERPKGGKGLFRVMGTQRKPKTRLLWDVSRSSVRVPATPTLKRTLSMMGPRMLELHHAALLEQLKRHHIAGY